MLVHMPVHTKAQGKTKSKRQNPKTPKPQNPMRVNDLIESVSNSDSLLLAFYRARENFPGEEVKSYNRRCAERSVI